MLSEGQDYMMTSWWLTVFPGLAIVITTLAVNIVGDTLRDKLDPKLRLR
jgi:peptide/nickel transport system permease protein